MTQSERVVNAVVKSFYIANFASIGFVAPFIKRLIDGEELVEHIAVVDLLIRDALVDFRITACDIIGKAILWEANSLLPLVELEASRSL
jgi:hypothetical protein